jgi:hypothetical protein
MIKYLFALTLAVLLTLFGCATVNVYRSNPSSKTVDNEYFDLLLEPQPAAGYYYFDAFRFVLSNKSGRPLSIVWDQSYYLLNGRKNGQFGWEGMTSENLKEVRKNPHVEAEAGETITAVIFPLKMMAKLHLRDRAKLGESGPEDQFEMGPLPQGENGMLLTVRTDGKVIQETVAFEIGMTPMNSPSK